MLGRVLTMFVIAASLTVFCAGPTMAKKKQKKTEETTSTIIPQAKCTGMKTMHWDDATHTCQKNK